MELLYPLGSSSRICTAPQQVNFFRLVNARNSGHERTKVWDERTVVWKWTCESLILPSKKNCFPIGVEMFVYLKFSREKTLNIWIFGTFVPSGFIFKDLHCTPAGKFFPSGERTKFWTWTHKSLGWTYGGLEMNVRKSDTAQQKKLFSYWSWDVRVPQVF